MSKPDPIIDDLVQELYGDPLGGTGALTPVPLHNQARRSDGLSVRTRDADDSEFEIKRPKKDLFPMLVRAVDVGKYDYLDSSPNKGR